MAILRCTRHLKPLSQRERDRCDHVPRTPCRASDNLLHGQIEAQESLSAALLSDVNDCVSKSLTIRHENITYPKKIFSNYFPITVSRFRSLRINFRKLPDTYCICVSCVTLPGWDPCPCRIIFFTVTRFEFFRINWVMFSWRMVHQTELKRLKKSILEP